MTSLPALSLGAVTPVKAVWYLGLLDPESLCLHLAALNLTLKKTPKLKAKPFAFVSKSTSGSHAVSMKQVVSSDLLSIFCKSADSLQHPVSTAVLTN